MGGGVCGFGVVGSGVLGVGGCGAGDVVVDGRGHGRVRGRGGIFLRGVDFDVGVFLRGVDFGVGVGLSYRGGFGSGGLGSLVAAGSAHGWSRDLVVDVLVDVDVDAGVVGSVQVYA